MPQTRKIATCCYCGSRTVLVLDRSRHELACSACGAPLHEMKMLPMPKKVPEPKPAPAAKFLPQRPKAQFFSDGKKRRTEDRKGKRRKRKPLSRKIFEEIWDVVEDIFD